MTSKKKQADDSPLSVNKQQFSKQRDATQNGIVLSELSQNDITILAETFRLLGDPSRLKIMLCCLDGSSSVGEIAECLDLSQSLVSHHLRLLRGARLVKGTRQAKQVFYEVADMHVSQVLLDMASHVSEDDTED
ncbi:metalloregulator ArsR/SmtB family transcription factor [Comamonas sp. Y6]|uniref:Metalloregulator ArsR/SmtB family transcription factor n=1 Tax=Comamonas resistens TaxID=3046670 RepID=A0ABY8SRV3_9BURK|nr:metalloregulator ArsR/SmtB family transcription factor [Comamonas resistens]MDL5035809.1 metalloregulator ArsR/SmtB family transcription factor [Comamonas resistens]WHS65221.1 metalloregulator ArsR/SmtB family transcription factor [Comamonas resistens]HBP0978991.1 winged helix-turn-helix transcriptional regulator [Pseudomonas aeruginosa]